MPRQSQLTFNNLSIPSTSTSRVPSTSTSRVPSSSPSITPSITSSSNALPELDLLYNDLDSSSHSSNPTPSIVLGGASKKEYQRKSWVYNYIHNGVSRDYEFKNTQGKLE